MDKKLAIVGIFFDGYQDLWDDFVNLFHKFWPECPYDFYIVNQAKKCDKNNTKVLNAGADAEYSKKVRTAIENIDADYYLFLLEDFFFSKHLDKDALENIFTYIVKEDINYCALPLPEFSNSYKGDKIPRTPFRKISKKAEYTVSCQAAIWKKDFIKKCIGDLNYNAWIFEGVYSKSNYAHTDDFLKRCLVCKDNTLGLMHGALQGKMIPDTVNYFKSISYYFKTNREVMSKKMYRKHKIKCILKNIMPLKIQKFIKKNLKTKSVVEKYKDEINQVMKSLNIE